MASGFNMEVVGKTSKTVREVWLRSPCTHDSARAPSLSPFLSFLSSSGYYFRLS